jgi:hypothetical protein
MVTQLVPELGPSLGRLVAPVGLAGPGAGWIALDDVRLGLVTALFELAGAAREFGLADDPTAAAASLSRKTLLDVWELALAAAGDRVAAALDARLASAAAESRLPARRRAAVLLTGEERRAIRARLGAAAADFVGALDALEVAAHGVTARGEGLDQWRAALLAAARRLESAWMSLEKAAAAEEARWSDTIEAVRRWHRPLWPLWLVTAAVVALTVYLGLVLGGYLPVPPLLKPLADTVWSWSS